MPSEILDALKPSNAAAPVQFWIPCVFWVHRVRNLSCLTTHDFLVYSMSLNLVLWWDLGSKNLLHI